MSRHLAISLMVVAFLTGGGVGFMMTPVYQELKNKSDDHGTYSDLGYLKGLESHHQQALDIARQGLGSSRPEVKALSQTILEVMPGKIEELKAWRSEWFKDTTQVSAQPINLGSPDGNFDLRWVNALDAHHREAITMAKNALKSSTRNEILTLSSEIVRIDTADLETFAAWRTQWYLQ